MLLRASFVEMFFCTSFFVVNVDKMQAVFYRRCHTPSFGPYLTRAQSIIRADIKCVLCFHRLLALVSVHQKVYVLRNKQGGLFNATQLLQNFLQHLLPENE